MNQYAVLLPGDEGMWERFGPDERKAGYARHEEFARLLTERGHQIAGGAELAHSREARVVRGELDDVSVTDGPYAESVEQLTGFYLVRTDDLDDLLKVCGLLADLGGPVEVRQTVDGSSAS